MSNGRSSKLWTVNVISFILFTKRDIALRYPSLKKQRRRKIKPSTAFPSSNYDENVNISRATLFNLQQQAMQTMGKQPVKLPGRMALEGGFLYSGDNVRGG